MSKFANVNIKAQDSTSIDAFGRWRVSNPVTIFDSKLIHDAQTIFWDDSEVSGSGTSSTYDGDKAMTRLAVSANTAGMRVRQTYMHFNYQPGKSVLTLMTAVMSGNASGIEANVGQHDDDNGIFFQAKDGILNAVIRSSTSGSAVDTKVAQSSWNGDKLDGTGASKHTVDPTKCQIIWWDYEWLGVGRVRMGFVIDGAFILCHEFNHANSVTEVYMSTPNLPLRYSIENDGTGPATTMDHICSTVISEGGSHDLGELHYASTAGTHVDADADGSVYAIVGVRLKTTHLGAVVKVLAASVLETAGSNNYEWILVINPTIAGSFTYADLDADSAVQVATGATANTVTNGEYVAGGHGSSGAKGGAEASAIESAKWIGSAIDGTRDEIVLCVRPTGSVSLDIEGGLTLRALS